MKINSIKIKIEIELGTIYNLHACNTRRRRKPTNKKAENPTPRRKTHKNKPKTRTTYPKGQEKACKQFQTKINIQKPTLIEM